MIQAGVSHFIVTSFDDGDSASKEVIIHGAGR